MHRPVFFTCDKEKLSEAGLFLVVPSSTAQPPFTLTEEVNLSG